jgi:hypothetical protein
MDSTMGAVPPLRQRMIDDMRTWELGDKTHERVRPRRAPADRLPRALARRRHS